MNYPVWDGAVGGGLLIGLVAVTHVFVSHFAVGGGLFLVLAERRAYRRGDEALLGYVRRHSRFFALLTAVFGAVSGVGIWFTIGVVHPAATSALIHLFVWVWAIEWTFFVVEIAAVLLYVRSWGKVSRRTHLALGWIYALSAWLSLLAVNGILTFMFTPGAWLATRSVADAFLNPTSLPSLLVRTLAAIAFAGLYVFATAWREPVEARAALARYAAWWALPATVAGPLAAWLWFRAAPGALDVLAAAGSVTRAAHAFRLVVAAAGAYALVLAAVALLARRAPRAAVSLPVGAALLALGYASIGGAEVVREHLRKPYVLGNPSAGYLYVNALTPAEAEVTRRDGLLAHARWTRPAADDLETGREVFRLACRGCHTEAGVRRHVDGRPVSAILGQVRTLERRARMPAFPGSPREARALALWLASLDGEVGPVPPEEPAAAPAADRVALGRKVLGDFCLSCHSLDDPKANALRPLLRPRDWGSEEVAYRNIGRLQELNAAMILPFGGTDEERRALAASLAELARGNRP